MLMVWPAIISAGASLAGGLLSSRSQSKANDANAQQAALNNAQADAQFQQSFDQTERTNALSQANFDRQFHQQGLQFQQMQTHGIQDRVLDAQRAGVHPLFALGASSSGASPVSVSAPLFGSSPGAPGRDRAVVQPNDGLTKGLSAAARAGAGFIARNTPEAKLARIQQAEAILNTNSQTELNAAQAEWYRKGGPNMAQGRDLISKSRGGIDEKLDNMQDAIAKMFTSGKNVEPQAVRAARGKINTQAKDGSSLGTRNFYDEETYGELAQFATALEPWFETLGSLAGAGTVVRPGARFFKKKRPQKRNLRRPQAITDSLKAFDR